MTWKTPTFLRDWKRPPCHVVCIRFRFLVFKDISRFEEGPSRLSFCSKDLLLRTEWQMQRSAITLVRVGSSTRIFGLTFPGEFSLFCSVLNVFAISHDYARFFVQILRISPFYEAFIGLVDPLLFNFTLFLNVLISFAASGVISEL